MTNQLAKNPLLIDTANSTTVLIAGKLKVTAVSWHGYSADNNNCTITDANNMVVWRGNGYTDLSPVEAGPFGWINGLKVTALDSGMLSIFFE